MTAPSSAVRKLETPDQPTSHQERVHTEMFRAIELLGRKLERAEEERDRLTRRLTTIESSATLDKKTGRLYLPALIEPPGAPPLIPAHALPTWIIGLSLSSSVLALCALGIVVFKNPELTAQQVAALNAVASVKLAAVDDKNWGDIPADDGLIAANPPVETAAPEVVVAQQKSEIPTKAQEPLKEEAPVVVPAQAIAAAPVTPVAKEPLPKAVVSVSPANVHIPGEDLPLPEMPEKPEAVAATKDNYNTVTTLIAPDLSLPPRISELEKRAFSGVPEAEHDLATLYAAGKGISQDYKRAAYWFARAADGGIANAHYNLGVMFQQGLGVRQDMSKALGWYESAAELGHPEAMYNLGIAYIEGVGVTRDPSRGVAFFRKAANAGVAQASYNLGVLYESNFIGKIDTKKALDWYRVAEGQGHSEARAAVARLERKTNAHAGYADADAEDEFGEGDSSPLE